MHTEVQQMPQWESLVQWYSFKFIRVKVCTTYTWYEQLWESNTEPQTS